MKSLGLKNNVIQVWKNMRVMIIMKRLKKEGFASIIFMTAIRHSSAKAYCECSLLDCDFGDSFSTCKKFDNTLLQGLIC